MVYDRRRELPGPFIIGLCIALVTLSCLGVPPARSADRIVTVGVYENEPKVFTSESGKPAGVFIDIIEHIAEKEDWELRYVPGTWSEGLDRLEEGKIDLMPDVAYTAEREKIYSFHKVPVLSSWYQVYAPRGSNIHSLLDLNEKRILVLERSVQQEAFERLNKGFGLHSSIIPVPDYKTMFEMVARDDADAAITNRYYGMRHAKKFGLEDTMVVFEPSDLFFAAPKSSSKPLLDAIDRRLVELKKDTRSVYYASLKRWASEDIRFTLPAWLKILGSVFGVVLLMSLVGSLVLNHQVNTRTRELRQVNQEMEQRIIQRTAELAEARDRAEAADRLKSAFLATMSHELRTPLNSIIGFSGIMLQGYVGPLNDEQIKQLGMVRNSANHLLALINDVLDISKIEAGQLEVASERFDLRASINKVVDIIRPLAEKNGLALRMDVAPEIGEMVSDPRRVEQVLLNLLNNAIKFTEQGEVKLTAKTIQGSIRISVADTGIGIKPEDLDILFQPFRQISTGLSRQHEGTGLGLAICRRLADLLGGEIHAESEWGKGSVFTITLPVNGQ